MVSGPSMHSAMHFLSFWALAFVTLSLALVLLNVYYGLIGNDLALRSLGQEAAIAAIASLIEGTSSWLVVSFVPAAARALLIPALIVAIVYKLGHLEDWSRYDLVLFLMFQFVIVSSGAFFFFGHFQAAIITITAFGGFLAILGSLVRSL